MSTQSTYAQKASRGFAWNHLYKLTEFGLLNVYTMIIARHFGPEGSTPYLVYAALGTTISAVAAFGIEGVLLRFLPRITDTTSDVDLFSIGATSIRSFVRRLFAFRIFVVVIIFFIVAIVIYLLPLFSPSVAMSLGSIRNYGVYLIVFILAQGVVAFSTFAMIALLNTRRVFFLSLIGRSLLLLGGGIFLLQSSFTIEHAIQLHVASAIVNAALLLVCLRKEISWIEKSKVSSAPRHAISVFRDSIGFLWNPRATKFFLTSPIMLYGIAIWGSDLLSAILGRQPDILMIRAIYGENTLQVGLYNVASLLLIMTEYVFLLGLGGALVSILSKLAHDDESDSSGGKANYVRMTKARKEVAGFQNVTLLPLAGFMAVFPLLVVRAIYGNKYDAAVELVRYGIIALIICVGLFGGGLQLTSLIAIGKERLVFKSRLFWGITNLIANYFLILHFGGLGAIIGTNLANASACMTEEYFARKYIGPSVNYLSTFRITLIVTIAAYSSYLIMNSISLEIGSMAKLLIAAGLYSSIVIGAYLLFRIPEAKNVFMRIGKVFRS